MSAVLLEQPSLIYRTNLQRRLSYCPDCGRLSSEIDTACQRCGGDAQEHVSRIGEIYSYTIVRQVLPSFVLALVQLSSGQLVTAQIVDVGRELSIGLRVEIAPGPPAEGDSGGLYFSPLASPYAADNLNCP